jgi:hypothetical protein
MPTKIEAFKYPLGQLNGAMARALTLPKGTAAQTEAEALARQYLAEIARLVQ